MKYNIGDSIKTIDYDLFENTHVYQYHNRVGVILDVVECSDLSVLYNVLFSGTKNKTIWINELEVECRL